MINFTIHKSSILSHTNWLKFPRIKWNLILSSLGFIIKIVAILDIFTSTNLSVKKNTGKKWPVL